MEEKNKNPKTPGSADRKARTLSDQIVKDAYPQLVKYAYTALYGAGAGDIGRAEDIVQEAMIIAIHSAESFCASKNPTGWVVLTIRNTARNARRSDARLTALVSEYAYLNDAVTTDAHSVDFLLSGIIADDDFHLLKQHYLEGYSYRDLEELLGLSPSALAMRLKRAKSKFVKNYFLLGEKSQPDEHDKIGGVANGL